MVLVVVVALAWGAIKIKDRFEIAGEFFLFLKERKLWWIMPMVIVFLIAGLFILITAHSPIAAFIYPLF